MLHNSLHDVVSETSLLILLFCLNVVNHELNNIPRVFVDDLHHHLAHYRVNVLIEINEVSCQLLFC